MSGQDPLIGAIAQVRERYVHHDLGHVLAVMQSLENPAYYADKTLVHYFAAHRQLGSSDRSLISDLVHTLVRWRRRIERAIDLASPATGGKSPEGARPQDIRTLVACGMLLRMSGYAAEAVRDGIAAQTPPEAISPDVVASWLDRVAETVLSLSPANADTPSELAVRTSFPDWIIERWTERYSWSRAKAIATASRSRAPVVLRANLLRTTREGLIGALRKEGIEARRASLSPWGVVLEQAAQLRQSKLYREGAFEFQDEGSQLIALVAGAEPEMRVVDACAGGGGKALAMAASMGDRGEILALDTAPEKLEELRRRARRAGVSIVKTANASGRTVREWAGRADRVLVDAPCSGSGTWRRIPDGPAHLRPDDLLRLAAAQRKILTRYAPLTRPDGRLVYATCSLFWEENEEVVETWLNEHPGFLLRDAASCLPDKIAEAATEGPYLVLTPERSGTDGFFAAVMERSGMGK